MIMDKANQTVDAGTLREWLDDGEPVYVLDVRPLSQREEWQIPGSHYVDAYKRLNEGDDSVLNEIDIPDHTKVVTVCAAGRTSQLASNALRKKGIEAYSLEGGMKSWSKSWNTSQMQFNDFEVLQIRRTGKGCLSYIISSNEESIVIDASLPVEVYQKLAQQHSLGIKYVVETHIHADHLSRSKEVAEYFQVPLYLPIRNRVEFLHSKILAETVFPIGSIKLKTIQTPGHTRESVSFYIEDKVVFTGDTLFTNGVGRPDLKADEEESRAKAVQLYYSLKKLLLLPDEVMILPAHTNKPVEFDHKMISTTIGIAKNNISFLHLDENDFVNELLQKIPPTPANYLSIVEKNLSGNFSETDSNQLEAGANRCAIS
jgi:glyoxylase-like metal-dependent hydrolase (beta-lactamase superfamily II)/rhodanese-related sulfurtransferase